MIGTGGSAVHHQHFTRLQFMRKIFYTVFLKVVYMNLLLPDEIAPCVVIYEFRFKVNTCPLFHLSVVFFFPPFLFFASLQSLFIAHVLVSSLKDLGEWMWVYQFLFFFFLCPFMHLNNNNST